MFFSFLLLTNERVLFMPVDFINVECHLI